MQNIFTEESKRFFVLPWLSFCTLFILIAMWRLFSTGLSAAWFGVLLCSVVALIYMVYQQYSGNARISSLSDQLLLWTSIAGVLFAFLGLDIAPLLYTLLIAGAAFAYLYWYVRIPTPVGNLVVGQELPRIEFTDHTGNTITDWEKKPTVLVCARGNWCPISTAHIAELVAASDQFHAHNIQVIILIGQPLSKMAEVAMKANDTIHIYCDPLNTASSVLDITHPGGVPFGLQGYGIQTCYPMVIGIDSDNKVLFVHINNDLRQRSTPQQCIDGFVAPPPTDTAPEQSAQPHNEGQDNDATDSPAKTAPATDTPPSKKSRVSESASIPRTRKKKTSSTTTRRRKAKSNNDDAS